MSNEPRIQLASRIVSGFELVRRVASTTTSSVFEAVRGNTRAAIKIYPPHSATRTERNDREEQAQREIAHPCVARVLAAERLADGTFVLVSEWIDGSSLEARLSDGPLAWPAVISILRDLARGLGAIHGAKVVHRDLKPSNVVLPASGSPSAIIVDFGHALILDEARLTATGLVLGSAHYMAPEQGQGLAIDHRADLYSVGVMLYRMLTGVLPFDHASPAEVMRMHQQELVVPPRARTASPIPHGAEDLCLWLLAKDPALRVPNARVLRLTIEALERSASASMHVEITT